MEISNYSCRACLKTCFHHDTDIKEMEEMFQSFTGYEIQFFDPQKICKSCCQNLKIAYEFKKTCENTQNLLEKVRPEYVCEDDSVEVPAIEFLEVKPSITEFVRIPGRQQDALTKVTNYKNLENCFELKLSCLQNYIQRRNGNLSKFQKLIENYGIMTEARKFLPPIKDTTEYEVKRTIFCDFCGLQFSKRVDLLEHIIMCTTKPTDSKPIECETCTKTFLSNILLETHLDTKLCGAERGSNKLIIKCTLCDYKCEGKQASMKLHCDTVHKISFKCTCGNAFGCLDLLRLHITDSFCQPMWLSSPLHCNFCQFSCNLESNMIFHVNKMHHNQNIEMCSCGKYLHCKDLELEHTVFTCTGVQVQQVKKLTNSNVKRIKKVGIDFKTLKCHIRNRNPTVDELFVLSYENQIHEPLSANQDHDFYDIDQKYVCDICSNSYRRFSSLRVHVKDCAKNMKHQYICPKDDCSMVFLTQNMLKYHLETSKCGPFDLKNAITCSYCNSVFPVRYATGIQVHVSNVNVVCNKKASFKCVCGALSTCLDELRSHCARKLCTNLPLLRKLRCNYCEFSCCYESNIRYHMKKMHSNVALKSCECGEEYYCNDLHLQHLVLQCINTPESVRLPFQFMLGPPLENLKLPESVKSNRIVCELCGKDYEMNRLAIHMNIAHTKPEHQIRYTCDICNKSYLEKINLKRHMDIKHLNKVKYPCEYCGKVFGSLNARMQHKRVEHVQESSCVCEICGKGFIRPSLLALHQSIHTDVRNYPCGECNGSFKNIRQLSTHKMNVHSTKRYPCTFCGKQFKRAAQLRQHALTHKNTQT